MKFLFEKFIAPRRTGRYGRGEIAASGTIIFPYLFVRSVSFFADFFEVRTSTASNIYFFPRAKPRIEPRAEPRIVAITAR